MNVRVCNICKIEKNITDFFNDKSQPGGRMYRCKECDKKKSANYQRESGYNRSPERLNSNQRRKAKSKIANEVKQGRMKRASELDCADCGTRADHYHHESYAVDKMLDVIPLCTACHSKRHNSPSPGGLSPFSGSVNQPNEPNQLRKPAVGEVKGQRYYGN